MTSIVVLTGAGISAESGIRTFRDQNGLWENHRIEDVASPAGFRRNPQLVQTFYNMRRAQLQEPAVRPNAAHQGLAELERRHAGEFLLVTQNVDDLHERAGSRNVIHMHGELLRARCTRTQQVFGWKAAIEPETECPCCSRTGTLRPHIVWFGEMPFEMERIFAALTACDLFLSIGTSGVVYPAAGFVAEVPQRCRTIEFNVQRSAMASAFREHRIGKASEVVPEFVREWLSANSA